MNDPLGNARQRWREQQRAHRNAIAETQLASLAAQETKQVRRTEHGRRSPPVSVVDWAGQRLRVLNREQAQAMLGRLRDLDQARHYDLVNDAQRFPSPRCEEEHTVFLLAEKQLVVDGLVVPTRLPEHPNLRIDGLICAAGLEAKWVRTEAAAIDRAPSYPGVAYGTPVDGNESSDGGLTGMALHAGGHLVVLGAARIGELRLLTQGWHAFTQGLECDSLVCSDYRDRILVHGPLRIGTLLTTAMGPGNDVLCSEPPVIGRQAGGARVIALHGREVRHVLSTHLLKDLVAPQLLVIDARGRTTLDGSQLLDLPPQSLLRPEVQIAATYDGFASALAIAMRALQSLLEASGMARLQKQRHIGFAPRTETMNGHTVVGYELAIEIQNSRLRAVRHQDGGDIFLHLESLTSPKHLRHSRWAGVADGDREALSIKLGLLLAMEQLQSYYQIETQPLSASSG